MSVPSSWSSGDGRRCLSGPLFPHPRLDSTSSRDCGPPCTDRCFGSSAHLLKHARQVHASIPPPGTRTLPCHGEHERRGGFECACPLSPGALAAILALGRQVLPPLDARVPECGSKSALCVSPAPGTEWVLLNACLMEGRKERQGGARRLREPSPLGIPKTQTSHAARNRICQQALNSRTSSLC